MKFGRKISVRLSSLPFPRLILIYSQTDLYSEWRPFYIDYNLLKRELKVRLLFPFSSLLYLAHAVLPRLAPPRIIGMPQMNRNSPICSKESWTKSMTFKRPRYLPLLLPTTRL